MTGLVEKRDVSHGRLLLPMRDEMTDGFKLNIISKMNSDQISLTTRNDYLILKFDGKYYENRSHLVHLHHLASQKMRELARFF